MATLSSCTSFFVTAFLVSVFCTYVVCCRCSRDVAFFANMRFLIAFCLFINVHKLEWKEGAIAVGTKW